MYATNTIQRALERTNPEPTADTWFTATAASAPSPAEPAAPAPKRLEPHVVTGVVDPKSIPVRKWIVDPQVPVGDVALCVGAAGISKSTMALRTALAVVTGREDILRGRNASGNSITNERLHYTGAVLVYNAEDRLSEMQRRLRAAQAHYGVTADMKHSIILWSGVDMPAFKIMNRPDARNPLKRAKGADLLEAAILHYDVELVIVDPLIALADGALENDNNDMNAVFQAFTDISAKLDIGMMLLHHTGKGRDKAGDESAARGASAIIGARANCRLGRSPATPLPLPRLRRPRRDALPPGGRPIPTVRRLLRRRRPASVRLTACRPPCRGTPIAAAGRRSPHRVCA